MARTFNSIKDLAKYVGSSQGQSTLINQSNVKQALNSEAQRLQRYLIEEINSYYQSYSPIEYSRTGKWLESIKVNPVTQIGNMFSISISFDDSLAYHDSIFGGEKGYVPWLFEVGWQWKNPPRGGHIHRLSQFEGIQYIKKSVDRWNRDNKFGFTISVYHGSERYI